MKTFRNLKSSLAGCIALPLLCLMFVLTCAPLAGCGKTSSPPPKLTPLQIMQGLNTKLPTIKAAIDLGGALVSSLDQATAAQVTRYVGDFDTLEAGLQTQVTAYLANPTADGLTQIQNQVNTFESSVNTSTLQAAGIVDPATQQKVLAWIKVIARGVTLVFADIAATETAGQLLHLRSQGDIHLARLRPYLDERELRRAAGERGVDLDRSFKAAEAFGF